MSDPAELHPELHPEQDPWDRLYLDLKGAHERLCRAQHVVPPWWTSDLGVALKIIEEAGASLCPKQWSRHMQPEYGSGR